MSSSESRRVEPASLGLIGAYAVPGGLLLALAALGLGGVGPLGF